MNYRKKPVVIEALQWDGSDEETRRILAWIRLWGGTVYKHVNCAGLETHLLIRTLEGDMIANKGDWIIRGVKDEFYPCKPDIFAATYEVVE